MRKIWKLVLFTAFFLVSLSFVTTQAEVQSAIQDEAHLLPSKGNLTAGLREVATKINASLFVVTTDTDDRNPSDFSKDYLASKITRKGNGVVLLINMALRKTYIWATGNMQYYLPSSRIEGILDRVQPELSDGNYVLAVQYFIRGVEQSVEEGLPKGENYTINKETGEITIQRGIKPIEAVLAVIVALICGGIFYGVTIGRYQLKLGTWEYPFRKLGQVMLTERQDVLVNSFITTRRITRSNEDSGGFSDGGSGGGRSF